MKGQGRAGGDLPIRAEGNAGDDGGIVVTGVPSARIGEIAARSSLTLHELTPIRASLEDAFMELTSDAVEYRSRERQLAGAR